MTATSHSDPDPLAALPLLAEAGVSVYWQRLDGRTAWVADADTREVWISRAIPGESVLRYLIEALQFLDESGEAPSVGSPSPHPRLVHAADEVERASDREPPVLRVVRNG
jgi:hypothetical protein